MSLNTNTGNDGGDLSLSNLLTTLQVVQHPETYVFATVPSSRFVSTSAPPVPFNEILLFLREACTDDQTTLIIPQSTALAHHIPYTYECKMLTCNVHSSLNAVGFMAVLATKLAERNISANPISGYFHDHIFVPVEMVDTAVEALEELSKDAEGTGKGHGQ